MTFLSLEPAIRSPERDISRSAQGFVSNVVCYVRIRQIRGDCRGRGHGVNGLPLAALRATATGSYVSGDGGIHCRGRGELGGGPIFVAWCCILLHFRYASRPLSVPLPRRGCHSFWDQAKRKLSVLIVFRRLQLLTAKVSGERGTRPVRVMTLVALQRDGSPSNSIAVDTPMGTSVVVPDIFRLETATSCPHSLYLCLNRTVRNVV